MLDFIVDNYFVILVVCILLIFAIIGYIIDTIKTKKYENANIVYDSYIPEEEIFIKEEIIEEETKENELEEMLKKYNEIKED